MNKKILSILLLSAMMVYLITLFVPNLEQNNLILNTVVLNITESIPIKKAVVIENPKLILHSKLNNYIDSEIEKMNSELSTIGFIEDKKEWFVAYKKIISKYSDVLDPPETIYDYFTDKEIELICRVVETEAYEQSFDAKCSIANVVFNRWYSNEFGKHIIEIIKTPNQFAYDRCYYTEETLLSVMYAFEICDSTDGALYFHSNEKTSSFNNASYIFTDCAGHHFYK